MDQQLNYFGAAIFWLYILAALVFSGVVIYTIFTHPDLKRPRKQQYSTDAILFSSLACISFGTLSYNMLNVLIQSYVSWSAQPVALDELKANDIWRWSVESTLFQDFGKAIVASGARQMWTQAALIATMSVCLFMGAEGMLVSLEVHLFTADRHMLGHGRRVPGLWAFFCLAQILPISFTQNLFYLALLRLPRTGEKVTAPRLPIFVTLLVYSACLVCACLVCAGRSDLWLLPSILTARVALFAPLLLCNVRLTKHVVRIKVLDVWEMQKMLAANALHTGCWWLYTFPKDELTLQQMLQSVFEHPAVSSLGCDFIICILSFAAWTWRYSCREGLSGRADTEVKSSS